MEAKATKYPFEVPFAEIEADLNPFISVIFSSLESEFLILPKGPGFVEYPVFERGYEILKQATNGFQSIEPPRVMAAVVQAPVVLIVLRTMLGFTPPEWAYVTTQQTGIEVGQGFARSLDRRIRLKPFAPFARSQAVNARLQALVEAACAILNSPLPSTGPDKLHRLDKADTRGGPAALQTLANIGVPYAMLLYERFLGRPFAGHRDSVSELVGDSLETRIEDILSQNQISYRKTKRAERVSGFDQAPDFVIPSEFNPQVVIKAKITEDDGTARDKVTRVQHLAELSRAGQPDNTPRFEVVACIAGRGFGVRHEDMRKLLIATHGKVFTLKTLDRLVEFTRLREFKSD